ncbi:MAG TPA: alpha/beta hydrolase-fold protein [Allosphingosinicella sp.]
MNPSPVRTGEGFARLVALAFALLVLFLPAAGHAGPWGPGELVQYRNFPSRHVEPRNVTVWLPPGYDPGGLPYAVLYMHDGQNVFDRRTSGFDKEWGVDEAVTKLVGERRMRPAIVVGIWSTPKRLREYVPARAFDRLPPAYIGRVKGLYGGAPLSDEYLRFLVGELKPFIDRTFNVRRDRRSTAIMGSSMGGLISLYAISEHPDVFGAAGMVSTHWPLLLPPEGQKLSDADRDAVASAFEGYLRQKLPRPGRHRLYFDHGTETLDRHYAAYQARIDRLVAARGWSQGRDWISRNFPGAAHEENSWRARVDIPLTFLLGAEGKPDAD